MRFHKLWERYRSSVAMSAGRRGRSRGDRSLILAKLEVETGDVRGDMVARTRRVRGVPRAMDRP